MNTLHSQINNLTPVRDKEKRDVLGLFWAAEPPKINPKLPFFPYPELALNY